MTAQDLIARLRDRDGQELMSTDFWERLADHIEAQAAKIVQLKVDADRAYKTQQELRAELAAMEGFKDGAYLERNRLVGLLTKLCPSGKKKTAIEGWSEDWHGCVYIDLPTGQASWHYHDSQSWLFDHLPEYQGVWDGHTTEEKYERISQFVPGAAPQQAEPKTCTGKDPLRPCQDGDACHYEQGCLAGAST